MSRVELSRTIAASATEVWSVVSNIGAIHEFHPRIECSPIVGDRARGVGAERRCELVDGTFVLERVTDWHEGRSLTIEVLEGSAPLTAVEASIHVEHALGAHSRVTLAMSYEPPGGFLRPVVDALFVRRKVHGTLTETLDGLEAHVARPAKGYSHPIAGWV